MRLHGLRPGDEIVCEVRGARFTAVVRGKDERGLSIDVTDGRQLPRGWFIAHVTARQVVGRSRGGTTLEVAR